MNLNRLLNIYIVMLIFIFSSCIPRTTVQTHTNTSAYKIPDINQQLPVVNFTFSLPTIALNEIEAPKTEITENFTTKEISQLRVKDNKLFAKSNKLSINLDLFEKDEFAFPLPGGKIISPYGGRRKSHTGVDIKTHANDTIISAFDGIVRMSKAYSAYGNVIVIRHYNGLETIYSHNSKNFVKPGDVVKAGTPIALTGRTGRATTEHLHFEIRINGEHFNPEILINFRKEQLKRNRFVFTQTKKGNVLITPASIARPIS